MMNKETLDKMVDTFLENGGKVEVVKGQRKLPKRLQYSPYRSAKSLTTRGVRHSYNRGKQSAG